MPTKILHFYKQYFPESKGGVEQSIYQLCEGALQHGVLPKVLTLGSSSRSLSVDNHEVIQSKKTFEIASTGFSLQAIARFKQMAKEADLIHFHFPWPFMDMVQLMTQVKKPSLVTYHSDIVKQKTLLKVYRPLMLRFLSHVNHIVATSPSYIKTSPVLQQFPDKVSCIPLGINESLFPKLTSQNLLLWQSRFPNPFFLFVGQLRYYKGLNYLLKAAKGISSPILIAGDGPEMLPLKELANELNLTNVHFLGSISDEDKASLLRLCRCFVFPSHLRSEAFGLALLEAAMHGKPMISCEIGTGTSYINQDQLTGIVIPPADADALHSALNWMETHASEANSMGFAARARYLEHFTGEVMVNRYVDLYQQMLS